MRGSIFMRQFQTRSVGHNGGSTYLAPRDNPGDEWRMCVKVDRLERIKYLAPLELPEYKEWDGKKVPDLMGIVDPGTGKTLRQLKSEVSKTSSSSTAMVRHSSVGHSSYNPHGYSGYGGMADREWDNENWWHQGYEFSTKDEFFAFMESCGIEPETLDEDDFDLLGLSQIISADEYYEWLDKSDPEEVTVVNEYEALGCWTYPPVCETCEKDPGDHYEGDEKFCQWCRAPQEENYWMSAEEMEQYEWEDEPDVPFDDSVMTRTL
jgi:hypothetical protein